MKILIIVAHPDDMELGMGGTALKLSRNNSIALCVLCKGNRPVQKQVEISRTKALQKNINLIGIQEFIHLNYSDVTLDTVPFLEISSALTNLVVEAKPDIVFTHYDKDIHTDHRIVSLATRIACRPRPNCTIKELYEFPIPGSTEWGFTEVRYNTFFNITDHARQKYKLIKNYKTEVRYENDPMSIEAIMSRDEYYGSLIGVKKAEPFINIFSKK